MLLFDDIYAEETNEKMGTTAKVMFFIFVDIPFLFVSYFVFGTTYRILKGLIYPKILYIDIENKVVKYENRLLKLIHQSNFDNFEIIEYEMITVDRGEDNDYNLKFCIQGKDVILYLTDRIGNFDFLDLKFISNHLGIPITQSTTEMTLKEYNEFRKKELEDRKLETREMYFL